MPDIIPSGCVSARRWSIAWVSAFRWVWRDRRGGVERETERSFARFVSSNLRIDLLGIVSALGERLGAALESGIDLLDLRARNLYSVDTSRRESMRANAHRIGRI